MNSVAIRAPRKSRTRKPKTLSLLTVLPVKFHFAVAAMATQKVSQHDIVTSVASLTVAEYWVKKLPDGTVVPSWPYLKERAVKVDDESKCTSPWCPSKPEIVILRDEGPKHQQDDPMICDCKGCDCQNATIHRQILTHIDEISKLFYELHVAYGVTKELSVQVNAWKDVDLSVPLDGRRGELTALSHLLMELKLGDDK